MKSLSYIPASDGSGDASLMTITQVRTAPATTIIVNTVAGAPTNFFATMGTPHTFNDPVTGETITVISEATAVNFAGHIDSGKVEIDAIAPGETDIGSKVGDIIVIRPTTQWANNLHDVLAESLNDDGSLKAKSVKASNVDFSTFDPKNIGIGDYHKLMNFSFGEFDIGFSMKCYCVRIATFCIWRINAISNVQARDLVEKIPEKWRPIYTATLSLSPFLVNHNASAGGIYNFYPNGDIKYDGTFGQYERYGNGIYELKNPFID